MPFIEKTIKWRDTSSGVIQRVSSDLALRSSVPFSINLLFDKEIGQAVSREGTAIIGSQLSSGNSCLGLYNFRDSDASNHSLIAAFNGSLYDVGSALQTASGLTSTAKCNFTTFLDTVLMLNGVEARSSANPAVSWLASGGLLNVGQVPAGAQFPMEFKDRLYASVIDRLYFTNTPTGGSVSWTASGSGSIQIEREDGGGTIRGISKVPGYLMIYKERSLKRWNFDSTFPEDLVSLGTQSHKSVVMARGRNYFFYGPKGFYVTNGGYPKRISKPIQRFIDAIPSSYYANVNGWTDEEHIYWGVGDLTINFDRGYTETHNNVVLRYTIDSDEWAPLKYGHEFMAGSQYISGTDVLLATGNTNGEVLQINTGNSDYGTLPITYILQSPEFDFGSRRNLKTLNDKIIVHSDLTVGAEIQYRIDYKEWKSFGELKDIVTEVPVPRGFTGFVFEFRIVDSIVGEQVKLRGIDFPAGTVEVHASMKK